MSDPTKSARSEGTFEKVGGTIKKNVGHLLGDEQMELEGKVKEIEGEKRVQAADAVDHAKGAVKELLGAVENRVGHLIDNKAMQEDGKKKETDGRAQRKAR